MVQVKSDNNYFDQFEEVQPNMVTQPVVEEVTPVVGEPIQEEPSYFDQFAEVPQEELFTTKEELPEQTIYMSDVDKTMNVPGDMDEVDIAYEVDDFYQTELRVAQPNIFADKIRPVLEKFGIMQDRSERVAKSKNLYSDARALADKEELPLRNTISFLASRDRSDIVVSVKVLGRALARVPKEVGTAILSAHAGAEGATVQGGGDWTQRTLQNARSNPDGFVQDVFKQYEQTRILPGVPIKISDIAQLPKSISYSLTSMGAGLGAGLPVAALPVPGARVVAWATGTAASGKVAYEMSTYSIMQSYLDIKNEEKKEATGEGLTLAEEQRLKKDFNGAATRYGLWEAVPEALSNLAFGKLLTAPFAKMAASGVIKQQIAGQILERVAGMYGEELLTETITAKFQAPIEHQAGQREEAEITWTQAFKEVAPQTILLTTILGGIGASGKAVVSKIQKSLKNEIGEDHKEYDAILKEAVDAVIPKEELKVPTQEEIDPETGLPVGVTGTKSLRKEVAKTLDPKNFKTAEEYVEAQGDKVYHGGTVEGEFKIAGEVSPYKKEAVGVHFGTKEQADFVASARKGASTKEYIIDVKNPIRLEDRNSWSHSGVLSQLFEKNIITREQYDEYIYNKETYDVREILREKGYDGIVYSNTAEGKGDSYIAFSNEQIKTTAQLKAEWKKAQGKEVKTEVKKPKKKAKKAKVTEEITVEPAEQEKTKDGVPTISLDKYTFKGYSTHFNKIKGKFGFKGEVKIDTITLEDQEKKAFTYAQNNPQKAMQIAHGIVKAPPSVFPDAIRSVVVQALIADGKHAQAEDVARKMSKSFSEAAQTLNIAKLNVSSSTKIRHDITKARLDKIGEELGDVKEPEKAVEKKVKSESAKFAKEVNESLRGKTNGTTIEQIDTLIEELIC